MINQAIIKLASNTSNEGLRNKYSHKISLKNSICGDKITIELITRRKKIISMKYETESCIYCEASASLLSKNIKNLDFIKFKEESLKLRKIFTNKNVKISKKFENFNKLINSDNLNRIKCIF